MTFLGLLSMPLLTLQLKSKKVHEATSKELGNSEVRTQALYLTDSQYALNQVFLVATAYVLNGSLILGRTWYLSVFSLC